MMQSAARIADWVKSAHSHDVFYPSGIQETIDTANTASYLFILGSISGLILPSPVKTFKGYICI